MKLIYWLLVAAVACGGAVVGWAVLPSLFPTHGAIPEPEAPPSAVAALHRFALSADDAKLDKESPALAVDASGRTLLAWASQTGPDEYTLFLARSDDLGTTFSPPAPFCKVPLRRQTMTSKGKEHVMVMPLLPRLAARGDAITLGWLEPEKGRVRFLTAVTRDGGRTFCEPVCVHAGDAVKANYTALVPGADGSTVALWLDQRKGSPLPFCSVTSGEGFAEAEVYGGAEGKGVCPCCDLDGVRTADGVTFAAFRNAKDGHRDVYVSRSGGPGLKFEDAVAVTADAWTFDGCPHDGPSLAVSGGRLCVAWMDAHVGRRQVFLATSPLDKLSFKARRLGPDVQEEQGHPRLLAAGGTLHAAWDQALPGTPPAETTGHQHGPPVGSGRAIVYCASRDGGETFGEPRALAPVEGAFQTRPVLVASADGTVLVAWHELGEDGKGVVVARLSASASAGGPPCCATEDGCCCDAPSRGAAPHGK